jgi:hypothetical protein
MVHWVSLTVSWLPFPEPPDSAKFPHWRPTGYLQPMRLSFHQPADSRMELPEALPC